MAIGAALMGAGGIVRGAITRSNPMGFNSVLVVLNDRLDEIERDPHFGKKVADAIKSFSRSRPDRMPYVTGQTQVVSVEHADTAQIIKVAANRGAVIGYGHWTQEDDDIIKGLEHDRKRRIADAKKAAAQPKSA